MAFQTITIPNLPTFTNVSDLNTNDLIVIEHYNTPTNSTTYSLQFNTFLNWIANQNTFLLKNVNETTTGTIQAAGFIATSTEIYKENIIELKKADAYKILELNPKSYTFKDDSPVLPGKHDIGLIAEEVGAVLPNLVLWENGIAKGIQYERLSVYLLGVVKDLNERIRKLEHNA